MTSRITPVLLAALLGSTIGCGIFNDPLKELKGQCGGATCSAGSVCDNSQNPPVCVVPQGECFPQCAAGKRCESGQCVQNQCPAEGCSPGFTCSQSTNFQCVKVETASIEVTSPGADAFVGASVQATTTAVAPGGVTGVRFEVRRGTSVLGSATAVKAATQANPDNYAATIALNGSGLTDGLAQIVAIETWNKDGGSTTTESAGVAVKVDATKPTVAMNSDGNTTYIGPSNPQARPQVTASDTGSGIGLVSLTLTGVTHAPYTATAKGSGVYEFAVPIADLGIADGASGTVAFSVSAADAVNNVQSLSGDAKQIIKVDRVQPNASITSDTTWKPANGSYYLTGTVSDADSGMSGGSAGVSATLGTLTRTGTLTTGTFKVTLDLGAAGIGQVETAQTVTVSVTDAVGNSRQVTGTLNIDNKAPAIAAITLQTAEDAKLTVGGVTTKYYQGRATGNVVVTADITDLGSGVDASTVALKYTLPGTGTTKTVPGVKTTTADTFDAPNRYKFLIPRSDGVGLDGSQPVSYTIVANDVIAAGLTGTAKDPHVGQSVAQQIFFDGVGPSVTVAADTTVYNPTQTINVSVQVADVASGVNLGTVTLNDGAKSYTPNNGCGGGTCTFAIAASDFTVASGRREGTLALTVSASDNVGNANQAQTPANAGRFVDGEPPQVTINKIYVKNGTIPSSGIKYPDPVTDTGATPTWTTGYNGNRFLYTDTIHVSATIGDGSAAPPSAGVSAGSLQVRLDGTGTGTPLPIAQMTGSNCADGTASCVVEFEVPLNASNGGFDTVNGTIKVSILASDKVGNTAATAIQTGQTAVSATRFWWSRQLPNLSAVSGLAIHPAGDVIVTGVNAGATDSVFSLDAAGPTNSAVTATCAGTAVRGAKWCFGKDAYGLNTPMGAVPGPASIGEESAPKAKDSPIYVASGAADFFALSPSGARLWNCNKVASVTFNQAAAVAKASAAGIGTIEMVIATGSNKRSYRAALIAGVCDRQNSSALADTVSYSAPIVVGSTILTGTNGSIASVPLDSTANFGAWSTYAPTGIGNITGLAYADGQVFGASNANATHALYQTTESAGAGWTADIVKGVSGDPVVDATGRVVLSNTSNVALSIGQPIPPATNPVPATLANLAGTATTPLVDSKGDVYLGLDNFSVVALRSNGTSRWSFTGPSTALAGPVSVPPTIDCSGHLYVAAADTVYAILTDAQGLADSPWPKARRDSRNTGNAGAPVRWGALSGGTCLQ